MSENKVMVYNVEKFITGDEIARSSLRGPGGLFDHAHARAHSDLEAALGRTIAVEETTVRIHVSIQVKTGEGQ